MAKVVRAVLADLIQAAEDYNYMKTKSLLFSICMLAVSLRAQLSFTNVDQTTRMTNMSYNYGIIYLTNDLTGAISTNHYGTVNTNYVTVGDSIPSAFSELNLNFSDLSSWLANVVVTNNPFVPNGYVLYSTNTGNGTFFGAPPVGGGGGNATNAIGILNGTGTNATLFSTFGNSNTVSGIAFYNEQLMHTNAIVVFGFTPVPNINLNGDYFWNPTYTSAQFPFGSYVILSNATNAISKSTNGTWYLLLNFPFSGEYTNIAGPGFLTGTYTNYTGDYPSSIITVGWLHQPITTNSVISMNGVGAAGSEILWPGGDEMYEQSMSDTQVAGDYGLYFGFGNGQLFGEEGSFVAGEFNDIQGSATHILLGSSIAGGGFNLIGDTLHNGHWSHIAGGMSNSIVADNSFASGMLCNVTNNGNFMFNDGGAGVVSSTTSNQFVVHAANGFVLNGALPITTNLQVYDGTNLSTWYFTNGFMMRASVGSSILPNLTGLVATYSTNASLVAATSLQIAFSPAMPDTNYIVTAPNDLVGVTVSAQTPTNFTLTFNAATVTSQIIQGAVVHK